MSKPFSVNRVYSLVDPILTCFDGVNSLRGCPKNQDGYVLREMLNCTVSVVSIIYRLFGIMSMFASIFLFNINPRHG